MKNAVLIAALAALSAGSMFAANAANGSAVFAKSCKSCHGADGTANPAIAKMMNVEMADLKSAAVQGMSDADMKGVVTNGKGKMKPVKAVTGADVDDVVAYVHTLKK
jgi:mono/diheme cytochrome c family protein